MATHSSMFAWKILGTDEPGGLQSMGSQRVGHDHVTERARSTTSGQGRLVMGVVRPTMCQPQMVTVAGSCTFCLRGQTSKLCRKLCDINHRCWEISNIRAQV